MGSRARRRIALRGPSMGGGGRAVAALYQVRPVAAAEEAFYRWFAKRRARFHRLGVTPECEEAGSDCG